jgi:putative phosphoesterase
MIKIAFFTDAHANLPATQAALQALQAEGYDVLYHLGDAIAIGPYPRETLERLLETPRIRFIRGNHDDRFLRGIPDPPPPYMAPGEVTHQRWTHEQLDPACKAVIARWPWRDVRSYEGVRIGFQHYAFAKNGEGKEGFAAAIRAPTAEDMDHVFDVQGAALICYGHHHSASDVTGQARYLNPGSLGCSGQPVARYAVLCCEDNAYTIAYRQVPYDDSALFEAFEAREVPERAFIYRAFMGRRFPR